MYLFTDNERLKWRKANKLEFGGTIHLSEEALGELKDVHEPGRQGVDAWLGKYLVKSFNFNKQDVGQQDLTIYGARIWAKKENKKEKMTLELATGQ